MLAYARGNLREAASLAKKVLRLQRHNAQAYEILGDVYRQERRIEEAIAMFTCALQCNPRSASAQSKLDALLRQRYFAGVQPSPASPASVFRARYGLVIGWAIVMMLMLAPWYLGLEADGVFQGIGFVSRWSMALVLLMLTSGMLSGALMALGGAVEPITQVLWWPHRQGMPQARLAVAGLLGVLGLFAFYASAFFVLAHCLHSERFPPHAESGSRRGRGLDAGLSAQLRARARAGGSLRAQSAVVRRTVRLGIRGRRTGTAGESVALVSCLPQENFSSARTSIG